jgi:hypothetical protein
MVVRVVVVVVVVSSMAMGSVIRDLPKHVIPHEQRCRLS